MFKNTRELLNSSKPLQKLFGPDLEKKIESCQSFEKDCQGPENNETNIVEKSRNREIPNTIWRNYRSPLKFRERIRPTGHIPKTRKERKRNQQRKIDQICLAGRLKQFLENWNHVTTCTIRYFIIKVNHTRLIKQGALLRVKHCKGQFLLSLLLVRKPSGDYRFILNLKHLNKLLKPPHYGGRQISNTADDRELLYANY